MGILFLATLSGRNSVWGDETCLKFHLVVEKAYLRGMISYLLPNETQLLTTYLSPAKHVSAMTLAAG